MQKLNLPGSDFSFLHSSFNLLPSFYAWTATLTDWLQTPTRASFT
jgi:hypothetical protein